VHRPGIARFKSTCTRVSTNWRTYCTRSRGPIVSACADVTCAIQVRITSALGHDLIKPVHPHSTMNNFDPLKMHGRFAYRSIHSGDGYRWPNGAGLAVYLGFNL